MSGRLIDYEDVVPFRSSRRGRFTFMDHTFINPGPHCARCGCRPEHITATYPCGMKPSRKRVWFWSEGDDE